MTNQELMMFYAFWIGGMFLIALVWCIAVKVINSHFFHKWNNWSEISSEEWVSINNFTGRSTKILRCVQHRTCSMCGKYQKRYIE
jgi:hypothetical protein